MPSRQERFFEFSWAHFLALVAYVVVAWRADGPWLVLGSLAVGGLIAGVWFFFWRRQSRSN